MNPKALESRNCKTPNCDREATVLRGRYAGLCDYCRGEKVRGEQGNPTPLATPSQNRSENGTNPSFEARAKRLVGVGKRLDQAVAKFKPAKETLAQAMADWKRELAQLAGEET